MWTPGDEQRAAVGLGYLVRQAACIGGGTVEMARNNISERLLGMPRDRRRRRRRLPRRPPRPHVILIAPPHCVPVGISGHMDTCISTRTKVGWRVARSG